MDKQANILKSRVFNSLDVIEKACIETSYSWDKKSKSIPIKLFGEIITRSKWELHPTNVIANNYINNFNKLIDLLETAAISSANSFKSDSINLNYISESIKVLKDAFIDGTKKK